MVNEFNNPYHYWWKVRKYWKMPKFHLAHIGKVTWWFGLPCNREYYNKYFDCFISGLGWKDKYDVPRFEWDPYLCITFFRKWQIIFVWNYCPYFMKKENRLFEIETSESTWTAIVGMAEYGWTKIEDPKIGRYVEGVWVEKPIPVSKNLK